MSKPIAEVLITTQDELIAKARAVFDTGSFFTILRQDKLPAGAAVVWKRIPREFSTAASGGKLRATAELVMAITIGEKTIEDSVLVSPDLAQEMLIGAGTMQKWDITIQNKNGETAIIVGRDLSDPDITEID